MEVIQTYQPIFKKQNLFTNLRDKIEKRTARVGIIGMGYVGSALAECIIAEKYETKGLVRSSKKAQEINDTKSKFLTASTDSSLLQDCDIIIVCVQTPIHEDKSPDLSFLRAALTQIASHLRPGQLIIIESSIAPGTTRTVALPILKNTNFSEDLFFLSFSPERVDPGNKSYAVKDIPKIVSGLTSDALTLTCIFYKIILDHVVPVSSLETAEMVKIFENTFRLVNISLVEELLAYTNAVGLDIYEVISAASTKPFGFMPHFPGPGVGGHCIPVDPYYLVDDAKKKGISLKLIEQAGSINDKQSELVAEKAADILAQHKHDKGTRKILLLGISYKADIDDTRESAALKIWKILQKNGMEVVYYDPYVPKINGIVSKEFALEELRKYNLIIITTNHSNIPYDQLLTLKVPILDTRHVFAGIKHPFVFNL